jgi:GntR family transcriptional regulator
MTGIPSVFQASRFAGADSSPLYARIKKLVRQAVASGELHAGDAIPGERDVARMLDVSRVTVRKAFSELVAEGVLTQRRGSGTYVNQAPRRLEQPLSRLTSFTEDMRLRGLATDSDWLDRSTGLPTPEESLKLAISPAEHVSRFHRLRRAGGAPMALELAVIPRRYLPNPSEVGNSLYSALEARGFRPVRALQRLHATALSADHARLLQQSQGSPALFIERISYLGDGRIVEFTRSRYRGDTYDFVAELTLAPEAGP